MGAEDASPIEFESVLARPATIRRLDIERADGITRLTIESDARARYQLERREESRFLDITIDAAINSDPTAGLDLVGTPIREIRTRSLARRTVLTLALDAPQRIRTRWAGESDDTKLVIELEGLAGARDRTAALADPKAEGPNPPPPAALQIERSAADRIRADRERSESAAAASIRAARRAHAGGDLDQAVSHYMRALEAVPGHRRALFEVSPVLVELDRLEDAIALVRTAREQAPEAAGLTMLHAQLVERTGDLEGAIRVLERAAPSPTDAPEIHALAAAYLQQAGNHELAIDRYETLLRRHPERPHWWMGLGISFEAAGREADALDVYRIAMQVGELPAQSRRWVSARVQILGEGD